MHMKHALCIVLLLGFALVAVGQNATVVALEPKDAKELKAAYERLQAAQKAYDDLKTAAVRKYAGPEESRAFRGLLMPDAWEFSADFDVLVPKATATTTTGRLVCPCGRTVVH